MSTRVGRNPFEKTETRRKAPVGRKDPAQRERTRLEKFATWALVDLPAVSMFLAFKAFMLLRGRVAKS